MSVSPAPARYSLQYQIKPAVSPLEAGRDLSSSGEAPLVGTHEPLANRVWLQLFGIAFGDASFRTLLVWCTG